MGHKVKRSSNRWRARTVHLSPPRRRALTHAWMRNKIGRKFQQNKQSATLPAALRSEFSKSGTKSSRNSAAHSRAPGLSCGNNVQRAGAPPAAQARRWHSGITSATPENQSACASVTSREISFFFISLKQKKYIYSNHTFFHVDLCLVYTTLQDSLQHQLILQLSPVGLPGRPP